MSTFRLSEEAEADLTAIWLYIASDSGSVETASRVVDGITERFWFLGEHPHAGRRRGDLRPDLRSFAVEGYVIIYRIDDPIAVILHVVHGSRDISALFRH